MSWKHCWQVTLPLLFFLSSIAQADALFLALKDQAPSLKEEVLSSAITSLRCAEKAGYTGTRHYSVIDYSLPSTEVRYWLFDLEKEELVLKELVAHGKNTGANRAKHFSNTPGSKQSSLGLFQTDTVYHGRNGYSLRLHGLEEGFNDKALDRAIVMHGAPYVSESFAKKHGRLGRSWGCPAFREEVAKEIIDTIKHGELVFIYFPDKKWLEESRFLHCGK